MGELDWSWGDLGVGVEVKGGVGGTMGATQAKTRSPEGIIDEPVNELN